MPRFFPVNIVYGSFMSHPLSRSLRSELILSRLPLVGKNNHPTVMSGNEYADGGWMSDEGMPHVLVVVTSTRLGMPPPNFVDFAKTLVTITGGGGERGGGRWGATVARYAWGAV